MTSDLDIYRSAQVLLRELGEDAALEAAKRADAMLEEGNIEGQRIWLRIGRAVKELQKTSPDGGGLLH